MGIVNIGAEIRVQLGETDEFDNVIDKRMLVLPILNLKPETFSMAYQNLMMQMARVKMYGFACLQENFVPPAPDGVPSIMNGDTGEIGEQSSG